MKRTAALDAYRLQKFATAVEINLTSNEFILGVKDDDHSFMLYRRTDVPIVIATDEPGGILRTNLTQQYVLVALRYGLDYYEIKKFVRNSIHFAFMPVTEKAALLKRVEKEFAAFEKSGEEYYELI